MANRVVLTGRLVADPELRSTKGDIPITVFTIAVPKKFKKDGADFIDVVAWRQKAEFVCQYFSKGKWIEIDGSIQTRSYNDKDDKPRKAFEILADEVNFVGDKSKDEPTPTSAPPAPRANAPSNYDPFKSQPPTYSSGEPSDFAEYDEDGDLPF